MFFFFAMYKVLKKNYVLVVFIGENRDVFIVDGHLGELGGVSICREAYIMQSLII